MTWFYDDPDTLDYSKLDEPIRELCKKINQSDWLRTEESCAGHNSYEQTAWGTDPDLYLRLCIIKKEHQTLLLELIQQLRDDCKGLNWHLGFSFDRIDELGEHWYFHFNYYQHKDREMCIDYVLGKINEVKGIGNETL